MGGRAFVWVTLFSEAAILFIAAQAGFIGGPRVISNMALDRWLPSRFAVLSDRLVSQNGILVMSLLALGTIFLTHGSVGVLVVLYSINVFITFSLSMLGMVKHWWQVRKREEHWRRKLATVAVGLFLTVFILVFVVVFKFGEGGWVTLLVTGALILASLWVKRHYRQTKVLLGRLDQPGARLGAPRAGGSRRPPWNTTPRGRRRSFW
jgi:amino acid transporter